jgi:hypothetical protein
MYRIAEFTLRTRSVSKTGQEMSAAMQTSNT